MIFYCDAIRPVPMEHISTLSMACVLAADSSHRDCLRRVRTSGRWGHVPRGGGGGGAVI